MENDIEMIYAIAKKIDMPEPVQASICRGSGAAPGGCVGAYTVTFWPRNGKKAG